ncbi:MAG: formylglycine-generating enzyme family protein, partial [Armatimonadota bacterium]
MKPLSRSDFLTRSALALAGGAGLMASACSPRANGGDSKSDAGASSAPLLKDYVARMRPIPGGTFRMGSNQGGKEEKPVHTVTLSPFRMGATPVTVGMWKEYCSATGTSMPSTPAWGWLDDHPVVNVSWADIMGSDGKGGYCAWASEVAGFRLTLPTEAQWEYGARGGKEGLKYPWGNDFDGSKLWCSKEYGDV